MYIKINNGYFFNLFTISAHDIGSGDCNVVYVTETICLFLIAFVVLESFSKYSCVMARRPDSAESIFEFLRYDLVTGLDDSSTWKKCCFPSLRWDHWVPIILYQRLLMILREITPIHDILDIPKVMNFEYVGLFRWNTNFLKVCSLERPEDALFLVDEYH